MSHALLPRLSEAIAIRIIRSWGGLPKTPNPVKLPCPPLSAEDLPFLPSGERNPPKRAAPKGAIHRVCWCETHARTRCQLLPEPKSLSVSLRLSEVVRPLWRAGVAAGAWPASLRACSETQRKTRDPQNEFRMKEMERSPMESQNSARHPSRRPSAAPGKICGANERLNSSGYTLRLRSS